MMKRKRSIYQAGNSQWTGGHYKTEGQPKWSDFRRIAISLVYERDSGICGICHKHVPLDEASLDHIVPKSHGGQHVASNLQLAHGVCNSKRHDTGPAQLRISDAAKL